MLNNSGGCFQAQQRELHQSLFVQSLTSYTQHVPASTRGLCPNLRNHRLGTLWTRNFAGWEQIGTAKDEWVMQIFYL